ncbi:MAG: hypothetical protein JXR16_02000 [Bermanella sp.]
MSLKGLNPKEYWVSKLLLDRHLKIVERKFPNQVRQKYLSEALNKLSEDESSTNYIKRIRRLLPNLPKEVVRTWLYDHNACIEDFIELPIEFFNIHKKQISRSHIETYEVQRNSPVDKNLEQLNDRDYQLRVMTDPEAPMKRILEYLTEHKKWPGRPIILHTKSLPEGYLLRGYEPARPLEVLEGFRRFSVYKHYCLESTFKPVQKIFLVTIDINK